MEVTGFAYHALELIDPRPRLDLSVTCEERKKEVGTDADPDEQCAHGVTPSVANPMLAPDLCGDCERDKHCVKAWFQHGPRPF